MYDNKENSIIVLYPGEVICDKCNGRGGGWKYEEMFRINLRACDKCLGDGKVNWIKNVFK